MQRIAIDMDEVLADSNQRFAEWYERDYQQRISEDQLLGKDFREAVPLAHREVVRSYPHREGFFKDMALMADCQPVLLELSKNYELFIVTAAMEFSTSFRHKYEWLCQHFPFIPWTHFVFCGDKSIIEADYLLDDHVKHFQKFTGQGILFSSPANQNEPWLPRVNNWQEVAQFFR
jgi:5'(3')-deoxyribonucleotidase